MLTKHLKGLSGKAITSFEQLLSDAGALDADGFRKLIHTAAAERFALAKGFLDSALRIPAATPADDRVAIGRSYYAMYQAARSVVFAQSRGDVDDHEQLPRNLPNDFPNRDYWVGQIAFWRVKRNEVDYSPYLHPGDDLPKLRENATSEASEFCRLASRYLDERAK